MDTQLAKVFVQRGIIRQGTIIEAYQSARGLSCVCDSYAYMRYVVLKARAVRIQHEEWVYFDVISSRKEQRSVRCDYVACIDGMAIERVAGAHQLNPDGSAIVTRGRHKSIEPERVFAITEVPK
jgi:hypothetical protein